MATDAVYSVWVTVSWATAARLLTVTLLISWLSFAPPVEAVHPNANCLGYPLASNQFALFT